MRPSTVSTVCRRSSAWTSMSTALPPIPAEPRCIRIRACGSAYRLPLVPAESRICPGQRGPGWAARPCGPAALARCPRRRTLLCGTVAASIRRMVPGLVTGLCLGLLALGPGLRRGFLLSYDMVFVPRQPIAAALPGLAPPRAVPSDLVIAIASRVVPADIAQKLVLLAIFVLG